MSHQQSDTRPYTRTTSIPGWVGDPRDYTLRAVVLVRRWYAGQLSDAERELSTETVGLIADLAAALTAALATLESTQAEIAERDDELALAQQAAGHLGHWAPTSSADPVDDCEWTPDVADGICRRAGVGQTWADAAAALLRGLEIEGPGELARMLRKYL